MPHIARTSPRALRRGHSVLAERRAIEIPRPRLIRAAVQRRLRRPARRRGRGDLVERLRHAQNRDAQARGERAVREPVRRGDEGGLLKCPMPPGGPARGPAAAGLRTTGAAPGTRDRGGGTATGGADPRLPGAMAPAGRRRERHISGGIRCARNAMRWAGSSRLPWSTTSSRTGETTNCSGISRIGRVYARPATAGKRMRKMADSATERG